MKNLFICLAFIFSLCALTAQSQTVGPNFHNALGTTLLSDTVTDTGTGYVQIDASQARGNVCSIIWRALEISGATDGTISLHGSNNGSYYAQIDTTTFDAADQAAAQTGSWKLIGSPCRFYRVTWTGVGTMAATIEASFFVNKED